MNELLMKIKPYRFKTCDYKGYQLTVDLDQINEVDFKALWVKIFQETELDETSFYVGYEAYFTHESKLMMHYYALAPSNCFIVSNEDHQMVTLPEGLYLLFENTLDNHGPDFFKNVYDEMRSLNAGYEEGFDLEVIPHDFDYENKASTIYVGLKLTD
jgi:hypothetical protein